MLHFSYLFSVLLLCNTTLAFAQGATGYVRGGLKNKVQVQSAATVAPAAGRDDCRHVHCSSATCENTGKEAQMRCVMWPPGLSSAKRQPRCKHCWKQSDSRIDGSTAVVCKYDRPQCLEDDDEEDSIWSWFPGGATGFFAASIVFICLSFCGLVFCLYTRCMTKSINRQSFQTPRGQMLQAKAKADLFEKQKQAKATPVKDIDVDCGDTGEGNAGEFVKRIQHNRKVSVLGVQVQPSSSRGAKSKPIEAHECGDTGEGAQGDLGARIQSNKRKSFLGIQSRPRSPRASPRAGGKNARTERGVVASAAHKNLHEAGRCVEQHVQSPRTKEKKKKGHADNLDSPRSTRKHRYEKGTFASNAV